MLSTVLSAATLAVSLSGTSSVPAVYLQGDFAHVLYSDLDLASGTDRQRLVRRIQHAARLVCEEPGPAPLLPRASETVCLRMATAAGVAQMNTLTGRR